MSQIETGAHPAAAPPSHRRKLGRDLALLLPASAAMYSVFYGMQSVLLPGQVESLGGDKVSLLAVLAAVGSIVAAVVTPLAGALSDRTRSRFGRRARWLLLSSMAAALTLLLLAGATDFFLLCATYSLVMAPTSRLARRSSPTGCRPNAAASAVVGAGLPIGILVGVNLVARVFTSPLAGYAALGTVLVVFTVVFVVFTRDAPVTEAPVKRPRVSTRDAVAAFFSSLRTADFRWAFIARASFMLGYYGVMG